MRTTTAAAFLLSVLFFIFYCNFTATEAAISCSDVLKDIAPCTSYLRSGTGTPSASCCSGVSAIASAAATSADRKAACSCLLSAARQIKPAAGAAKGLAGSCGISLPYAVSANIDCSKIK